MIGAPVIWNLKSLEFWVLPRTGFDLRGDRTEPTDTAFGYDVRGHSYSVTYDGPGLLDRLTAFLSIERFTPRCFLLAERNTIPLYRTFNLVILHATSWVRSWNGNYASERSTQPLGFVSS